MDTVGLSDRTAVEILCPLAYRSIHPHCSGGNFVGGSSNEPIYDPTGLVRQQQATDTPVIMVSINYR